MAFVEGDDLGGESDVQGLLMVDLADGTIRGLPGQVFRPVTWSPGGSQLLVELRDPCGAGILTLADDRVTRVAAIEPHDEASWHTWQE